MNDKVFTLQDLIRWAAEITGKGIVSDRSRLIDLIRESLDALHNEESVLNFRKWIIPAIDGVITLPKEVATADKFKICEQIGPVRNLAYQFVGFVRQDVKGYRDGLQFKSDTPTYYDLPIQGGRLAAKSVDYFEANCDPDKRPYLLVQGKDMKDREIFSPYLDKMDVGERVFIAQPSEKPVYTLNVFKEITSVQVVNCHLNIVLAWCNVKSCRTTDQCGAVTNTDDSPFEVGTLALYDSGEPFPTFRRYQIPGACKGSNYNVEILGKLQLPNLKFDSELVRGFDSNTIRSMIRANHYRGNNDINGASFNSNIAVGNLRKMNERETPNTDTLSVFEPTSGGRFPSTF